MIEIPRESGEDYKPGDIIIKLEPQVHCVTNECKSKFCDNCLKESNELKKCSKCLQMYYCNKDCQTKDWKCHKYECKVYRHPMIEIMPTDMRLLLRWWLCYSSDPSFSTKRHPLLNGSDFCFDDIQIDCVELLRNPSKMEEMGFNLIVFKWFGLKIDRKIYSLVWTD